jgi:predicted patatin/cPLA2 family phospholipase
MSDPVLDLLRSRREQGGAPGRRPDGQRLALVIEGGSSRGAYSAGMTGAIEQLGILSLFDAVYGSSAGALNGGWLLCGKAESTMHAWWTPDIMRGTIDPKRALRGKPVVDTHYLVHQVYTDIMFMGFDEILSSPVEFHPMATDADTGESVDLAPFVRDKASLQAAFRATTAMPLLTGRPIEIDGRRYVDAGVSESVPVRGALAQGATHVVALRTRRPDESMSLPRPLERFLMTRWFRRNAPGALKPWLDRVAVRDQEEHVLAAHPHVLQIRPPVGSPDVGHTEVGGQALRVAVDIGRRAAFSALAGADPAAGSAAARQPPSASDQGSRRGVARAPWCR